jgi:hypothetical protein
MEHQFGSRRRFRRDQRHVREVSSIPCGVARQQRQLGHRSVGANENIWLIEFLEALMSRRFDPLWIC